jgi:NAD(P)-dependent dehydrogenase (short-subunit alcohol dehydrogenase family)
VLREKTIVIAGVGPGLGEEVARIALREGARVVLGARSETRLEAIAAELDPSGARIAKRACDIERDGDCEALAELALSRFGGIDALACVAARVDVVGDIESTTLDQWRSVYETNVIGSVRMIRAALPALSRRGGSIVLIGSQSEVNPKPAPGFIAYGATKAAMHAATIYMAQQLGPKGIRVNRVVPSTMWTPTLEGHAEHMAREQEVDVAAIKRQFEREMPLGEMPSGEGVAEVVAFFLSERSRYVTGQALLVNSGEWMT